MRGGGFPGALVAVPGVQYAPRNLSGELFFAGGLAMGWWSAMLCAVTALLVGCTGSRWARDDPDYAAKYPHHTDNVARMTKQAIDARHVKGKWGPYAGLAGRFEPFAFGGEAGAFHYPTSYLEYRGSMSGLLYENDTPVTGGLFGGARLQTPTRLAPFVGLGAYGGFTPEFITNDDGHDNDNDGFVDEAGEENRRDAVFAVVPEAGVHFWLTPQWRLTGGLSYLVTTDGGDDFLLSTISLARLTGPGGAVTQRGLAQTAAEQGWQVGDGVNPEELQAASAPESTDAAETLPLLAPPEAESPQGTGR
jgi:hypothetical protein